MRKMPSPLAEFTDLLFGPAHRINHENKDQGSPCYTLPEMLDRKNITTLRKIGKNNKVRGFTKMDRESLIRALVQNMIDPDWLKKVLFMTEPDEWEFFKIAVKADEIIDDDLFSDQYQFLLNMGYLGLYYDDYHFHYVIPAEVRQVYTGQLEKTGFPAEKERADLLDAYAIAATNLYGIISKKDFVELFNKQNKKKTDINEIGETLCYYEPMDHGYILWDEHIANDYFEEDDFENFENVEDFLRFLASIPRYLPPKQEFLKYSDWNFIEETEQVKSLRTYLIKKLYLDKEVVEDLAEEFALLCRYCADINEILDTLEELDYELSMEQLQDLVSLISELSNNSRMWIYNGHTPDEILKKEHNKLKLSPNESIQSIRSKKVGRNEPCPCGSGKKYKKCCGQIIVFPGPPQ